MLSVAQSSVPLISASALPDIIYIYVYIYIYIYMYLCGASPSRGERARERYYYICVCQEALEAAGTPWLWK